MTGCLQGAAVADDALNRSASVPDFSIASAMRREPPLLVVTFALALAPWSTELVDDDDDEEDDDDEGGEAEEEELPESVLDSVLLLTRPVAVHTKNCRVPGCGRSKA